MSLIKNLNRLKTALLLITFGCLQTIAPVLAQEAVKSPAQSNAEPPKLSGTTPVLKAATIALDLLPSRHIAISIRINKKGPFRMILDTGSPVTFVSNKAAQNADLLSAADAAKPAQFGMRGQLIAKTLAVGEAQLTDFPILVLDHPVIEAINVLEGPVDGILGFSFWARYRTQIDYATKTVTFIPGTYVPDDMLKSLMSKMLSGKGSTRILASSSLFGMDIAPLDSKSGVAKLGSAKYEEARPGIVITRIYAVSAAAEAGLQIGDHLMELDGRWTDTVEDCIAAAAAVAPEQETTLKVQRAGKTIMLKIRPHIGL